MQRNNLDLEEKLIDIWFFSHRFCYSITHSLWNLAIKEMLKNAGMIFMV